MISLPPHDAYEQLRRLCPSVRFHRFGGEKPVSEELKRKALNCLLILRSRW